MRFQDKIAIVTGGGSGMGKEVATRFVAEGVSEDAPEGDDEPRITFSFRLLPDRLELWIAALGTRGGHAFAVAAMMAAQLARGEVKHELCGAAATP